jgi:hypothetical protein
VPPRAPQQARRHAHRAGLDRFAGEEAFEVERQFDGGLVATVEFLLERLVADRRQRLRHERRDLADRPRVLRLDLAQDLLRRRRFERDRARQHFVERDAERVDVRAAVDVVAIAADLLRTHVDGRADERAGFGQRRGLLRAREPEVRDHRFVLVREDQVRRLDVAVDDPVLVRVEQRPRRSRDDARTILRRELAVLERAIERFALDELHRVPVHVVGLADFVDLDDVLVRQLRDRLRLAQEALDHRFRDREARRQDFHRDAAFQSFLLGFEHDAHRAATDFAQHAELAELASEERPRQRLAVLGAASATGACESRASEELPR